MQYPDPRQFLDYRLWLKECFHLRKKHKYSFAQLSKDLDLGNRSFIQNILAQRQHLPRIHLEKAITLFGITPQDSHIVRLLHTWQTEKSPIREQAWEDLVQALNHQSFQQSTNQDLWLFEFWAIIPIYEYLKSHPDATPLQIQAACNLSLEISEIQSVLLIIQSHPDWESQDIRIDRSNLHPSQIQYIRQFQKATINKSADILDSLGPKERFVSTNTLLLNPSDFQKAMLEIKKLQELIASWASESTTNESNPCQLNFQFFPLFKEHK